MLYIQRTFLPIASLFLNCLNGKLKRRARRRGANKNLKTEKLTIKYKFYGAQIIVYFTHAYFCQQCWTYVYGVRYLLILYVCLLLLFLI